MKRVRVPILVLAALLLFLAGCGSQPQDTEKEYQQAIQSLIDSRPDGARLIPDVPSVVSDVRMTVVDRAYDAPSSEEDFQNLSMMQIWYGYLSGETWYDYPSENYDLVGILQHQEKTGWNAAIGSHMVRIGPYLLINVCVPADPITECTLSDTLGSQFQEPFTQYNTYHYYYDAQGVKHTFGEDHDHGYGTLAENPVDGDENDVSYNMRCEFMRHYYLLLECELVPEDYVLTLAIPNGSTGSDDVYTLTYKDIENLL